MNVFKSDVTRNDVIEWKFPVRRDSKDVTYVEYYVRNPQTGKMVRKRTKFNNFVPGRERDKAVEQYINNIAAKLASGWNPFEESEELKVGALLTDVCKDYVATISIDGHRPKTVVDYSNRLKHFREWAVKHCVKSIGQCTRSKVEEYLHYKLIYKKVSPTARNNDRTFLSAFFGWCISRNYIASNPCNGICIMKEEEKFRRPLTDEEKCKVVDYLSQNDEWFLLAVLFLYYTLIRPNELLQLRICDINIDEQYVVVPADKSKNHKAIPVAIPDRLVKYLRKLNVDKIPSDHYLFGYGCCPCLKQGNHGLFRYRWSRMREELGLPLCVQFYSLKDSGIIDLINAEGVLMARDQARHSSISVTNRYALFGSKKPHEEVKHFKGKM